MKKAIINLVIEDIDGYWVIYESGAKRHYINAPKTVQAYLEARKEAARKANEEFEASIIRIKAGDEVYRDSDYDYHIGCKVESFSVIKVSKGFATINVGGASIRRKIRVSYTKRCEYVEYAGYVYIASLAD